MKKVLYYRALRKERLLGEGFLPFEAEALKRNRIGSPAMRILRRERQDMWLDYLSQTKKPSFTDFRRRILNLYDDSDWKDKKGRCNPFTRLREIGEKFRDKIQTACTSPKKKVRVTPKVFKEAARKTKQRLARRKNEASSLSGVKGKGQRQGREIRRGKSSKAR